MAFFRKPGTQNGLENLKLALQGLDGKVGKVGWFPAAKYEDGTPVAGVAAIHEFGAPAANIPARPFFRPTIQENKGEYQEIARRGAIGVLKGKIPVAYVFEALGMKIAADVVNTISKITAPALKPATIKARMRRRADKKTLGNLGKPLIDTGYMIATITHTVEDSK